MFSTYSSEIRKWKKFKKRVRSKIDHDPLSIPLWSQKAAVDLEKYFSSFQDKLNKGIPISDKLYFIKNIDIPFTGTLKFFNAVDELEAEITNLTSKEILKKRKVQLDEIRKYLAKHRRQTAFSLEDKNIKLEFEDKIIGESSIMQGLTSYYCYELLQDYLIQTINQIDMSNTDKNEKSPWQSGLFYLFLFLIAIGTVLAVVLNSSFWQALLILFVAVIFLIVLGAFQLKNDDKLQDESFTQLIIEVIKKVPNFLKLQKGGESEKKADDENANNAS